MINEDKKEVFEYNGIVTDNVKSFNYAMDCCGKEKEFANTKMSIARRIADYFHSVGHKHDVLHIEMDLEVLGYFFSIDWEQLLEFPNGDLFHDYCEFAQRLDRQNHKYYDDCFVPRSTRRQ
jgi:hypothetical protein